MNKSIALSIPSFTAQDEDALLKCLRSGWVMQGPLVAEFEALFAKYIGVKHALAVSNCTTGLHLALLAMGIGPGDEVIVPAFSWVSTANAVEYVGAKVVFIDVNDDFNIDLSQIEKLITPKTKAIIPVHLFGLTVDIENIKTHFPDLLILEDAACAAGSEFNNKRAGSIGDIAAFSFHPRKSITTGEGGMITTNNTVWYEHILALRNHGLDPNFEKKTNADMPKVDVLGYNFRMTDLQASIGLSQMKRLDNMIAERVEGAKIYEQRLKNNTNILLPTIFNGNRHCLQSYVVLINPNGELGRDEVINKLAELGVATRPGTQALHLLGFYKNKYVLQDQDFPGAKRVYENSIAIPMHNKMAMEDYEYVADCVNQILG